MIRLMTASVFALLITIYSCDEGSYADAYRCYQAQAYERAYDLFQHGLSDADPIADYYHYYAGRAALKIGMYSNARAHFQAVLDEHPDSILVPHADQYRAVVQFILDAYPYTNYFGSLVPDWKETFVGLNAAHVAIHDNETNTAIAIYYALVLTHMEPTAALRYHEYTHTNQGYIKTGHSNEFLYALGRGLFEAESDAFVIYWTNLSDQRAYDEDYQYYLARHYYRSHAYTKALPYMNQYRARYTTYAADMTWLSAEMYRRWRSKPGRYVSAIRYYKELVKRYPDYHRRAIALRRISGLSLVVGRTNDAKRYLQIAYQAYPNSWHTEVAIRYYLRKMFLSGNKNETRYALSLLRRLFRGSYRADYFRSWEQQVYTTFGQTNEAREAARRTLRKSDDPFFVKEAVMHCDASDLGRLRSENSLILSNAYQAFASNDIDEAISQLNDLAFVDYLLSPTNTDMTLLRARELMEKILETDTFYRPLRDELGIEEFGEEILSLDPYHGPKALSLGRARDFGNAFNEAKEIRKDHFRSPAVFSLLEWIATNDGDYGTLMRMSADIDDYLGVAKKPRPLLLPERLRRYVYPTYYHHTIDEELKRYDSSLDRWFVLSIMREESRFDHRALSWANAHGLMQLMPATARSVNRAKRFQYEPLVLFNPSQNIALGVSHLHALEHQFQTNLYLIAASYNAGGGNGRRWWKAHGTTDPYYLTRMIDLVETEHYVEKVMESYHHYRALYREIPNNP